ncbi:MAG: metal-sensing transcriptional repressor [Roseburia sp.]|nr:metal-sensing transcriptional repressor [Anaeroplasma bactoclasticum]MCM1195703.1 metal-sensing transcriptional repressor [Roseburia sp.]MCM1556369.1 metal-sensing transcriptional repressor [Anaeroplasma bactoclasticum]
MECCSEEKKTYRTEEDKKILTNRLNRIEGQIRGVASMIQDDRYCDEILIQLSAIDKSIKSFANFMLDKHIKTCVKENILIGNDEVLDEIVDLFKRFQ